MFNRKITTVLKPSTSLKDELTLTTDKTFGYSAFVLNLSTLKPTNSGYLTADLPKKSNIDKVERIIDKYHRNLKNTEILISYKNGVHRKLYTDNFNRFTASKIEREDGITINMRGDLASHLVLKGNAFIQCDQFECSVFFPKSISIDYSKFSINQSNGSDQK